MHNTGFSLGAWDRLRQIGLVAAAVAHPGLDRKPLAVTGSVPGPRVWRPGTIRPWVAFLATAVLVLALGGCASGSAGFEASGFNSPAIAAAYLPLSGPPGALLKGHGAGVVVAPGVAVTNAHNAELIDPASVLGRSTQHDLLYFATSHQEAPPAGAPQIGWPVIAYGQGTDGSLRMARGVVLRLDVPVVPRCPLCRMQYAFAFEALAGQGFSGGPVVAEADGRLLGIIFGFLDDGGAEGKRTMYAYPMDLVLAEIPAAARPKNAGASQPELLLLAPGARR